MMLPLPAVLLLLGVAPAAAQDSRTVAKAQRLVGPDESTERIRAGFALLTEAIREDPDQATVAGRWLLADASALLAVRDDRGLASAELALDSYERALPLTEFDADLTTFALLEGSLHERAMAYSEATDEAGSTDALLAARLYLRADELRARMDRSKPVERARRLVLAINASLAAGKPRGARKLFLQLNELGGFMEPLALAVATETAEREGPHVSFAFLQPLQAANPSREKLTRHFLDLCIANGWRAEALKALERSESVFGNSYDGHLERGTLYRSLDAPDAARTAFESALVHAPRGWKANWGLAQILTETLAALPEEEEGESTETAALKARALEALEHVAEARPRDPEVQAALDTLRDEGEEPDPRGG